MKPLRFTPDEFEQAFDEWGANCGPGSIAALCGLSLASLRPHLGDFESKRYTNPTLMWQVLRSIGVPFTYHGGHLGQGGWPRYGLARIQWEGPWTRPGVPPRAYRHTHWIGVNARNPENVGIFDVNALGNGTGWAALSEWKTVVVPFILDECVPRASGGWYITHSVEFDL